LKNETGIILIFFLGMLTSNVFSYVANVVNKYIFLLKTEKSCVYS